jgi:AraC-like DNA-binding protein
MVACLWEDDTTGERVPVILPDGCTDLIWEQGRGAYLAGPDTGPVAVGVTGQLRGIRFWPGAGVLPVPLSELQNQRADLAELLPGVARELPYDLPPERVTQRLIGLVGDAGHDPVVTYAAGMLRDPRVSAAEIEAVTGLSRRQLRRRFHQRVGYGPKTLQRVLRFHRFVSRVEDTADLASLAAELGYADQAHLTRECVEFSGQTPLALRRIRASAG